MFIRLLFFPARRDHGQRLVVKTAFLVLFSVPLVNFYVDFCRDIEILSSNMNFCDNFDVFNSLLRAFFHLYPVISTFGEDVL